MIDTKKNSKCDDIYQSVISLDMNTNNSLFLLAQCFLEGYPIDKLKNLLKSSDDGVVLDGLFLCSEIGKLSNELMEEVKLLLNHADNDVRNESEKVYRCIKTGSRDRGEGSR